MIFVTVGTQLPFDRLVQAVDAWAARHLEIQVSMQIGESAYVPQNCEWSRFTAPAEWDRLFKNADLVISHAGMGTILKSLDQGKPLIVMPRRASLGEHRNEHQLATAGYLKGQLGLAVIENDKDLEDVLSRPLSAHQLRPPDQSGSVALIREIRSYLGLASVIGDAS